MKRRAKKRPPQTLPVQRLSDKQRYELQRKTFARPENREEIRRMLAANGMHYRRIDEIVSLLKNGWFYACELLDPPEQQRIEQLQNEEMLRSG
jgi:hypothetical protein